MSDNEILTSSELKKLKDAKILKYMSVVETLAAMIKKRLPSNASVEYDDLYMAGLEELTKQLNRIYSDKTLISKLYNPDKGDLTVGPFFLKGINSPLIKATDSGSLKFIKGKMWDAVRLTDPAPPAIRAQLKKINEFKNKYFVTLGKYPSYKVLREKFNLTHEQLDELLSYDE